MLIGGVVLTALLINVFAQKPKKCGPLGKTFTRNSSDYVRRSRVMGGSAVDVKEAPWVVRIDKNGKNICTGTLISKRHVLTAGHCFIKIDNATKACSVDQQEYSVCRLTNNNNLPCEKNKKHAIKKIHCFDVVKHGYRLETDFIVAELEKEIKDVTPVCLPIPENGIDRDHPYNKNTYYFGYSDNRGQNTQLKYASAGVPNVTDRFLKTEIKCKALLCPGDSGGPMIEIHDKKAVLIGINIRSDLNFGNSFPTEGKIPPYFQTSLKVVPLLEFLKDLGIPSLAKWQP